MVLVDTSIWIELLNKKRLTSLGDDLLAEMVTCGPVMQEVFQGLHQSNLRARFAMHFGALPVLGEPIYNSTFRNAADIYMRGRQLGFTIRSSIDCLIAAIAIENDVPVWHQDRDFDAIARFTALRTVDHCGH